MSGVEEGEGLDDDASRDTTLTEGKFRSETHNRLSYDLIQGKFRVVTALTGQGGSFFCGHEGHKNEFDNLFILLLILFQART